MEDSDGTRPPTRPKGCDALSLDLAMGRKILNSLSLNPNLARSGLIRLGLRARLSIRLGVTSNLLWARTTSAFGPRTQAVPARERQERGKKVCRKAPRVLRRER